MYFLFYDRILRIAHDDLVQQLGNHGHYKSKYTKGLFLHNTRNIAFTLVVDDFAIKYSDKKDVDHLLDCIREKCPVKVDWEAKQYIGNNLEWNYKNLPINIELLRMLYNMLAEN